MTECREIRPLPHISGRFTQEDPIGVAGGLNLYGYGEGDPVNNTDPFGLCPIKLDGIPCTAVYAPGVTVSSPYLRMALNSIAEDVDKPLLVYGGDRSVARNRTVGGSRGSSHLEGSGADVIFVGTSKAEPRDLLQASRSRASFGVRLLYHQRGSTLPEHSHLDLREGGDITEQVKGSTPQYVPLPARQP